MGDLEAAISGDAFSVYREMAEEDDHRIEIHPDELIESEDEDEDITEGMQALKMKGYEGDVISSPKAPPSRIVRAKGNTGPKGVLADYADAKERARLKREAEALSFNINMQGKAVSYNRSTLTREELLERQEQREEKEEKEKEADSDEEDEWLRQYREKRLRQLTSPKKKVFGFLRRISQAEFPDEIDAEKDSDIPVVIHLYKDVFPACVKLNYCLQQLAIKYPTIKFLKIVSTEAKATYDDIALPTLIVYKRGEVFRSFVKITDDLGTSSFDQDDVEALLVRNRVIVGEDQSYADKPGPAFDY